MYYSTENGEEPNRKRKAGTWRNKDLTRWPLPFVDMVDYICINENITRKECLKNCFDGGFIKSDYIKYDVHGYYRQNQGRSIPVEFEP